MSDYKLDDKILAEQLMALAYLLVTMGETNECNIDLETTNGKTLYCHITYSDKPFEEEAGEYEELM